MIKNLDKVRWSGISLMSPECNLDCSYCNIAKAKQTTHCANENLYFKECIQSIENGTYLANIKKAFERFKQSPKNISSFEIWGQEPTLIMPTLTKSWYDWGEYFTEIESIGFSTNGVAYSEAIADYLEEVDKYATKNIRVDLQFSYDGLYGEEDARGYTKEHSEIIENLIKLIEKFNRIKFSKMKIYINLHAVLSTQLLEKLSSLEKINLYFEEYDKTIKYIQSKVINKDIDFVHSDLIIQNCGAFTSSYGMEVEKFARGVDRLKENINYEFFKEWNDDTTSLNMLFGVMATDAIRLVMNSPYRNLDEYIDALMEDKTIYRQAAMCGSVTNFLRISHDGVSFDCHGSIYDPMIDEEKLEQTIFDQSRLQCQKHGRQINILTASDEEVDEFIDFYYKTHSPTVLIFMFHTLVNQIYLMSVAGQVDKSYQYDFAKLKRHALILARNNQCYHGLKLMNGSIFLRGNEEVRQICNGAMDKIDEFIQHHIDGEKGVRR